MQAGVTLIELVVVIAIVGILAAIAYPSYSNSIAKTKRRAAEACLSSFGTYMERFYTTNLRYDKDATGAIDNSLPALDCASSQGVGGDYAFTISASNRSTYTLQARPGTVQASRDARCGTLTLTQTGARNASGTDGPSCW